MTGVLVAIGLVALAIVISRLLTLGLERELAVTTIRAIVQLTLVGVIVTAVFEHVGLAAGFVALMFGAAAFTSSRRMRDIPRPLVPAGSAIALGAATGLIPLFASGAFETTPRELIPVAGILIGGAMAATSLTGRRLLDDVRASVPLIEARLALGAPVQVALRPTVRQAARSGLIPALDQTKNVGLVTLPGTFVGLVLGGADPAEAARVQLTVLLALLGVEVVAAVACALLAARACEGPGERLALTAARKQAA
jgi:putative ABC transport system permease protein